MTKMVKKDAVIMLDKVPDEYVFWCCDGRILKDMLDLKQALLSMSDDTFAYHVNEAKNDFTSWARDILKDEKLAGDLYKVTSRKQAAKVVTGRVATLSKKLT